MTKEVITCALVHVIAFLGLSGEEVVDPDAATSQLEDVAAILRQLDESSRREFIACVEEIARRERDRSGDIARSAFIAALPSYLGIDAE